MSKSKEIRWRKIGGGSLRYIRGKIIKPNEIFTACLEEVPPAFRKQVIALEDIPETLIEPIPPFTVEDIPETLIEPIPPFTVRRKVHSSDTKEEIYKMQKRSAGGWWDVVNIVSGKIINEKGLREDGARELVEELNI